jgi:hypothetical protein
MHRIIALHLQAGQFSGVPAQRSRISDTRYRIPNNAEVLAIALFELQ